MRHIVGLTCLIALSMPIGALSTVPATILRAQLRFSLLALYTGLELAAQVLMTVCLAWSGFGAWRTRRAALARADAPGEMERRSASDRIRTPLHAAARLH